MQAQAADFWSDQTTAKKVTQRIERLRRLIELWTELKVEADDLVEMLEIAKEDSSLEEEFLERVERLQTRFDEQESRSLLSGQYDANDAVLVLKAGAGGVDAMDWTDMLKRMYLRFIEQQEWKAELLEESRGEEAGIKSATILVSGEYAYGMLHAEVGTHRLVRLSPFNSDNLRQTSFASVEVLPELDDIAEIEIKEEELRIDTYRASGAGGQHVNKTDSAVRITHEPTGIVVAVQNERSQLQNKETALKILAGKLAERAEQAKEEELAALQGERKGASWGNQIRSYVLQPYKMVKDHRTNYETAAVDDVLDGALDPFIDAELKRKQQSHGRTEAQDNH